MTAELDPKATQEQINEANKAKIDTHSEQLTLLQTISLGVIIALMLGLISVIGTLNAMSRDADEFKSQLFIELIKTTQDTNAKINALVE